MKVGIILVTAFAAGSLLTQECGLKEAALRYRSRPVVVAPYAGVWIERIRIRGSKMEKMVALYAGVLIESYK